MPAATMARPQISQRQKTEDAIRRLLDRDPELTFAPVTSEAAIAVGGAYWSEPVRVKGERRPDGLLDLAFRLED